MGGNMNLEQIRNIDLMRNNILNRPHAQDTSGRFYFGRMIWDDVILTNFVPFRLGIQNIARCNMLTVQPSLVTNPFGPGLPTIVAIRDGNVGPQIVSTSFRGFEILPGQEWTISVDELDIDKNGKPVFIQPNDFWIELVTPANPANPVQIVHIGYGVIEI